MHTSHHTNLNSASFHAQLAKRYFRLLVLFTLFFILLFSSSTITTNITFLATPPFISCTYAILLSVQITNPPHHKNLHACICNNNMCCYHHSTVTTRLIRTFYNHFSLDCDFHHHQPHLHLPSHFFIFFHALFNYTRISELCKVHALLWSANSLHCPFLLKEMHIISIMIASDHVFWQISSNQTGRRVFVM